MEELFNEVIIEPLKSPTILWLSIGYLLCESISTYDTRLIQRDTRGFESGVAMHAGGRRLPEWVGFFAFIGWGLLIAIVLLNWKFGIALFIIKFILKVIPVLENIGAILMSPFLKD